MLRPFSVLLLGLAIVSSTTHWAKINKTLDMTCTMPSDGEKLEVCAWKIGDEGAFKSSFKKSDSRISIIMDQKNCSISINHVEKKDEGYWSCMMWYEDKEYTSRVSEKLFLSKIDHTFDWTCSMPDDGEKLQVCSWRLGEEGAFKSSFNKSHGGERRITVSQNERNCSIRMEKVEEADGESIECKVYYQHYDGTAMTLSKRRSIMEQPPLPQDQNGSSTNGANKNPGFKLKINEGEASTPLPHLPDEDPKDKLPNAYVDFSGDDDGETSAKLPKLNNPTSSNSLPLPLDPLADRSDSSVPPHPNYTSMQGVPNLLHHGSKDEDMKRVPSNEAQKGLPAETTYDENCHDGNPVHREILGKRDMHHRRPEHLTVAPLPLPEHHRATFENNKSERLSSLDNSSREGSSVNKLSTLVNKSLMLSSLDKPFEFAYSLALSPSAGAGVSATAELGVAVGSRGEALIFWSRCLGIKYDVSAEIDISIGFWESLDSIPGRTHLFGVGYDITEGKPDETEAGIKFVQNPDGQLVGVSFNLGVGDGPRLPINFEANVDHCYTDEIVRISIDDIYNAYNRILEWIFKSKITLKTFKNLVDLTHELFDT